MMAMIFIDDPYYPYKTYFLLATVLSNSPSPLFFFLTYSTSTATFNRRWIQAFHLFSCLKKKIPQVKTERWNYNISYSSPHKSVCSMELYGKKMSYQNLK